MSNTRVLIFAVEVNADLDVPAIGEYFDVENNNSEWYDARLAAVVDREAITDVVPAIESILSGEPS